TTWSSWAGRPSSRGYSARLRSASTRRCSGPRSYRGRPSPLRQPSAHPTGFPLRSSGGRSRSRSPSATSPSRSARTERGFAQPTTDSLRTEAAEVDRDLRLRIGLNHRASRGAQIDLLLVVAVIEAGVTGAGRLGRVTRKRHLGARARLVRDLGLVRVDDAVLRLGHVVHTRGLRALDHTLRNR